MNYTHLTREERYQIHALKKAGRPQSEIATVLERSAATISRELSKNTGGRGYRPNQAHRLATDRQAKHGHIYGLLFFVEAIALL
ncbi:MAG: hypothetical protein EPO42_06740 [Gallionellaceae bacterium]|nr:MAG: hypothetical protein EPO42_06740 [Gallionellaceae bacterium]